MKHNFLSTIRWYIVGVIYGIGILLMSSVALAASSNVSHDYHSKQAIRNGSLVSLDNTLAGYVTAANSRNGSRLIGVALASSDSLLAVDANAGNVQVATSGTVTVLASDLNGPISVGNQVAVSPFNGIGTKATAGAYTIGLAQTALRPTDSAVAAQTITNVNGATKTIHVGYIRLNIGVGTASAQSSGKQLNSLQKIVKSITGKTVSTARIVVSIIIALVALIALVTLMYASVYSGIISIGRNPLAKYAVFRTMSAVLVMALLLTLVAGTTIFLLLR